ncbi:MAG TPA: tetratricopeptide repeat protein [Gemmatimonadaceae bacterium]|nr:tetratricopeptide repeat protein [Gemmatimonadaceae bacterium]
MPEAIELIDEGRRCESHGVLDRALESYAAAASASLDPTTVAEALTHQSRVHRLRCEWEAAIDSARRAQATAQDAKLPRLLSDALNAEAAVFLCQGQMAEALKLFNCILDTTDEPRQRGIALQNIGTVMAQQGQLGTAERAFTESFGWFRHAGYRLGEAIALNNHARVALDRGNAQLAEQLLEEAIVVAREEENADLIALATVNLAEAFDARGLHDKAEEQASTALGYFATSGNRWREIECLRLIGSINERLGDYQNAERCYKRALGIAEEIGAQQEITIVRECLARVEKRARQAGSGKPSAASKR